jgi:hypothetical protein
MSSPEMTSQVKSASLRLRVSAVIVFIAQRLLRMKKNLSKFPPALHSSPKPVIKCPSGKGFKSRIALKSLPRLNFIMAKYFSFKNSHSFCAEFFCIA